MKITRDHWGKAERIEVGLADAIEASMSEASYGEGELERLRNHVDAQAKVIGVLVEALAEAGHLTEQAIANMLSYRYRIED